MSFFIYIFNILKIIIQTIIFIIGKTFVLYITVFRSWYLDIINYLFIVDYENIYHINIIILGWCFITLILKFLIFLILIYFIYNYLLLFKFLFKNFWIDLKKFLKYFK